MPEDRVIGNPSLSCPAHGDGDCDWCWEREGEEGGPDFEAEFRGEGAEEGELCGRVRVGVENGHFGGREREMKVAWRM